MYKLSLRREFRLALPPAAIGGGDVRHHYRRMDPGRRSISSYLVDLVDSSPPQMRCAPRGRVSATCPSSPG
jgi:hypothetical protein